MIFNQQSVKIGLSATPINSLERCRKINRTCFDMNIRRCVADVKDKKKKYCYCHSKDEVNAVLCKLKTKYNLCDIEVKDVIINGERYDGMWIVERK